MINVIVDEEVEELVEPPAEAASVVAAACEAAGYGEQEPKLCIRFASDDALKSLNATWRGREGVTDVLSFPMQEPPNFNFSESLGDIALAIPFIIEEAKRLGLPVHDHLLHLIVHATLHLLGFDHEMDIDADKMQAVESIAMRALELHDPYLLTSEEVRESL